MHTLLFYLDKTKGICKCYQVFISYVSYTGRSVCTKTVAQWLKEVLSNSGIDTAVFKAHSFRGLLLQPILTKAVLYSKFLRQGTGYLLKTLKISTCIQNLIGLILMVLLSTLFCHKVFFDS